MTLTLSPQRLAPIDQTLFDDLVSWWKLEEASGERSDELGAHPLTASTNDPANATGVRGNGCDFNKAATNSLTRANASAGLLKGDVGSWTFAAWIKVETHANNNLLLSCWGSGGDRAWRIVTKATDGTAAQLRFQATQDGSSGTITTAGATEEQIMLTAGTWYFYQAQHRDGVNVRMRIDAGDWIATAMTGGLEPSPSDWILGATFDGIVDEAAFWSRALSSAELDEMRAEVSLY